VAGRDASPYSLAYTTSYDKLFNIYILILQPSKLSVNKKTNI